MLDFELPQKLYIKEMTDYATYKEVVSSLFKTFRKDFIDYTTYFLGYPISIGYTKQGEDYPDIFWHIITEGDKKVFYALPMDNKEITKPPRYIDIERSKRLAWIKPIIQHCHSECLKTWKNCEFDKHSGKKVTKYYLWYEEGQFLVIIKEVITQRKKMYLATSFYVKPENHNYFMSEYNKGDKQPWT